MATYVIVLRVASRPFRCPFFSRLRSEMFGDLFFFQTALHVAAMWGHTDGTSILRIGCSSVATKFAAFFVCFDDKFSIAICAVCRMLIDLGADVNVSDETKRTLCLSRQPISLFRVRQTNVCLCVCVLV